MHLRSIFIVSALASLSSALRLPSARRLNRRADDLVEEADDETSRIFPAGILNPLPQHHIMPVERSMDATQSSLGIPSQISQKELVKECV